VNASASSAALLDPAKLLAPIDVPLPTLNADDPEFCAEDGWMENLLELVLRGLMEVENNCYRVPPTDLIGCSGGGKTRALIELAAHLRLSHPSLPIIFVSFNNHTRIESDEMHDSVQALCNRIAWSSLRDRAEFGDEYHAFRTRARSDRNQIVKWLQDSSCILLIDELNVLDMKSTNAFKFAQFLKTTFLKQRGRYFVVSSHVVPGIESLANFMDAISERGDSTVSMRDRSSTGLRSQRDKLYFEAGFQH
jgi:hypothetical protein